MRKVRLAEILLEAKVLVMSCTARQTNHTRKKVTAYCHDLQKASQQLRYDIDPSALTFSIIAKQQLERIPR